MTEGAGVGAAVQHSGGPRAAAEPLLSVRDLRVSFDGPTGAVRAVNGVSLDVNRGDVVAVVGESGSGKTVSMLAIMGLLPAPHARVDEGLALWKGEDLLRMPEAGLRRIRGKEIAMIFQNPLSALNPVHRVGNQVAEVLRIHTETSRRAAAARAAELLDLVGVPDPARRARMYPHELSGGMRQRVMIAMAIACRPDLLIADEPTAALDVTVQAQVLDVLMDIKREIRSAIVLITHDLGVVAGVADRVYVMYAGRLVERGMTDEVFHATAHPYTHGLLQSVPRIDAAGEHPLPIPGAPPSLTRIPQGCPFHPRCGFRQDVCSRHEPALSAAASSPGHESACHFAGELHLTDARS